MTSDTAAFEPPPPPPPPAPMAPTSPGWAGSDLAIGTSLVVLLVALFLPWFSATVDFGIGSAISDTGNGMTAHGYLWAVFVLVIVALIVLVARDFISRLPGNLPSPKQMLVGATGLALLLTVLGVAFKPTGTTGAIATAVEKLLGHAPISVSWSYGGFVAVLAAAVAFIAAVGIAGPLHSAKRATRVARAWRQPGTGV